MKTKVINKNYSAIIVRINKIVPLEGCDNIQAAIIMGNQVIVSKSVKEGDLGVFFPLECKLSKEYLSTNNLYRKPELNSNDKKKGFFEENGRVRCVRLRGNKSEGLFMPIESLYSFISEDEYNELIEGIEFNYINNKEICDKYVIKKKITQDSGNRKIKYKKQYESKLIENQFRFHEDTSQLYRNLHKINPDDIISITYKEHGTSGISSKVLCKRKLSLFEKFLKLIGVNISTKQYDYLYSSRKVLKNAELNPNANHFYDVDIWGLAHERVKDFLQDGMTLYYEIVGYLPNGGMIQKDYDYGCKDGEFDVKIYRITYTNASGKVFEFSAKQVQDWCKTNGIKAVEELYYGRARNLIDNQNYLMSKPFSDQFLDEVKSSYNEKDCHICNNKVPEEGCVIRIEKNEFEAYKCKSERFYQYETAQLDKGESNLEDE